jgi:hypothetical protein
MSIRYLRINSGDQLPDFEDFAPYKAVVVIDLAVDAGWQTRVSQWLVESGCLYMMAWGADCSSWDTSVDEANMRRFDYGDIPDDDFIMTTWHDDEPLAEVIWFAKVAAHHSTVEIDNVLFLHIGAEDRQAEFEELFNAA